MLCTCACVYVWVGGQHTQKTQFAHVLEATLSNYFGLISFPPQTVFTFLASIFRYQ